MFPIHIAWFLIWVAVIAGFLFLIVHATYLRYFAKAEGICEQRFATARGAHTGARTQTFPDRAAVSLDYGGVHVHAAVYRVSAEGRHPIRLGHLSLDRGYRPHRLHRLSYYPRVVLPGLLVDLAGQDRRARTREKNAALCGQARAAAGQIRQVSSGEQALSRRDHVGGSVRQSSLAFS